MGSITVVTPTRDRRDLVLECVDSLLLQTRPPDEILVVDNGGRDATPAALAARFGARVRTLLEPLPGVSRARNRGVEAARGDLIVFIDDDARAAPDWLERLEACFEETDALGVGGRVDPAWEAPPPAWLTASPKALASVGVLFWGDSRRLLAAPPEFLLGTNCAFRRRVFDAGERFRHLTAGRPGFGMEDVEFTARVARRGPVYYEPLARVLHRIPRRKASLTHLAACAFDNGRKAVETDRPLSARRMTTGVDAWTGAFFLAGRAWERGLRA